MNIANGGTASGTPATGPLVHTSHCVDTEIVSGTNDGAPGGQPPLPALQTVAVPANRRFAELSDVEAEERDRCTKEEQLPHPLGLHPHGSRQGVLGRDNLTA